MATDLCRYHFRTSEDVWKVEERQNDTTVVVGGCGIKTRWLSNSDEVHKKYNQTDATRQEHCQGVQPTVAVSPTCSFGNPKDTYYMHFLCFECPLNLFRTLELVAWRIQITGNQLTLITAFLNVACYEPYLPRKVVLYDWHTILHLLSVVQIDRLGHSIKWAWKSRKLSDRKPLILKSRTVLQIGVSYWS